MGYEYKFISATGLSAWLQCGLKFKYIYIDKLPKRQTVYFKFGSAIHKTLEYLGKLDSDYSIDYTDEFKNQILDFYLKEAAKQKLDDISLLNEGKDLILKKMDNFKFGKRIIDVENSFELDVGLSLPIKGQIDKVVELSDDAIAIVDYKTSKIGLSNEEVKRDIQLYMYDLAASILYPQYSKRVLILDYLRNVPVYSNRSDSDREFFKAFLAECIQAILFTDPDKLKPEINKFCTNCDFKLYCPAYKDFVNSTDNLFTPADLLSDDELVKEWERVKSAEKILTERLSELKIIISDRLREEDAIIGEKKKIVPKQRTRKYYNTYTVVNKIPKKDLVKLVSLSTSKVDKFLEENPKYKKAIVDSARYVLTNPWFEVVDK